MSLIGDIKKTVNLFPNKIAVSDLKRSITFKELWYEANCIANALRSRGLIEQPVAICLEEGTECICALLGIILSGNYYLIFDLNQPNSRLEKVLDNFMPLAMIYNEGGDVLLNYGQCVLIDYQTVVAIDLICTSDKNNDKCSNILSIVYTSGSTGYPKGVIVNSMQLYEWIINAKIFYGFSEKTTFGNCLPFYFIGAYIEIYTMLLTGASLHIIGRNIFFSPQLLLDTFEKKEINTFNCTAAAMNLIAGYGIDSIPSIKRIIIGGGFLSPNVLCKLKICFQNAVFYNTYGSTEILTPFYYRIDGEIFENDTIPIVQSFDTHNALILSEGRCVEKGEKGELCVRNRIFPAGYYRDSILTREKFVQNPLRDDYIEILYRTGDIAYENSRGELVICGRLDSEFKHHGYRVSAEDVEQNAESIEGVTESCCYYDQERELIVLVYSGSIDEKNIYEGLKRKLPQYMLPNKIINCESLPHNANGKKDRMAIKLQLKERDEKCIKN